MCKQSAWQGGPARNSATTKYYILFCNCFKKLCSNVLANTVALFFFFLSRHRLFHWNKICWCLSDFFFSIFSFNFEGDCFHSSMDPSLPLRTLGVGSPRRVELCPAEWSLQRNQAYDHNCGHE